MRIDLVFFEGCPHAAAARERLREALTSLDSSVRWNEWDTGDAATPEHLRGFSSPTVLVNGIDVERKAPTNGAGCAVGGGPTLEALRDALATANR
jgi:hypothetical protein